MRIIIRFLRPLLLGLALVSVPACTAPVPDGLAPLPFPAESVAVESRLTPEQAELIAQTALEGLNAGDYEAFAAAWSESLRGGIGPEQFAATRAEVLEVAGAFVRITDARVTPGNGEGFVRFYFLCEFERMPLVLVLALPVDGDEVVGVGIGLPE